MPQKAATTPPQASPTITNIEKKPAQRRRLWPVLLALMFPVLVLVAVGAWWFSSRASDELLYQTRSNNTGRMSALLTLGVDANARDRTQSTPLMGAAWRGQTEAVKILLAHGAAINARNGNNETPLILAAKEGHTDIVRLLLDKNPDVNAKDGDGWTCLMWASWGGYAETVKLLLSTGVRVDAQNTRGETASYLAHKKQYFAIGNQLDRQLPSPDTLKP
jgi:ankyrin repeat protein